MAKRAMGEMRREGGILPSEEHFKGILRHAPPMPENCFPSLQCCSLSRSPSLPQRHLAKGAAATTSDRPSRYLGRLLRGGEGRLFSLPIRGAREGLFWVRISQGWGNPHKISEIIGFASLQPPSSSH